MGTHLAAIYRGNRTFEVNEVPTAPPGPGEVRIKIAYCGICGTDLHVFHGFMDKRVGFNRVLGHEMSGTVDAVGEDVSAFTPGDVVVVRPLLPCGECPACQSGHSHICHRLKFMGLDTDGAFQQFWNVPQQVLHRLPPDLPLSKAALVEPLAVACHDVGRARIVPGERALVIGGGPIGILIALVARHAGAEVLVSEINENRLALATELGFATINPKSADVPAHVETWTGGKGVDVVFEVSGSQAGIDLMTSVAATRGRIVLVAIHATPPKVDMFRFFWREIDLFGARVYEAKDYDQAISLLAAGEIPFDRIVTAIVPMSEIQPAFVELDSGGINLKTLVEV